MRFRLLTLIALLSGLVLAACGGGGAAAIPSGLSMGGEALGGSARTTGLASHRLN